MFSNLVNNLNNTIWSWFFLPGLLLCALLLSFRCSGLQLKHFGLCMRGSIGKAFSRRENRTGGVSSFQAASTALASTVGTGNIVGTAQALCMGGPGAVFWMWAVSFLGMIVKYAEIALSISFRSKNKPGSPMYYIRAAFGRYGRAAAAAYAFFAALAGLGMGNMTQVNSAALSLADAVKYIYGSEPVQEERLRLVFGLVLAVLCLVILSGGAKSIGRIASLLVPFMSASFILLSLGVLCCHGHRLPAILVYIIKEAFNPRAALGASGGLACSAALSWGLRRSAFSNEAGLGSAAIAHGFSNADSPVEEGFWGVFEVFTDTTLLCTLTALVILCSGVSLPYGSSPGVELLCSAFSTVYGSRLSTVFVALCMVFLAFSSILGWALYGSSCWQYLFGRKASAVYRLIFSAAVVTGSTSSPELVWSLSDLFNALMSIPNLLAVFMLSGRVSSMTKDYLRNLIS